MNDSSGDFKCQNQPERLDSDMAETQVKKRSLHKKIVKEVLPRFGERLKQEGVISNHNRRRISIQFSEDWPPLRINPDRMLYCPDKKKILVEVANPRDPKRFMGEILYPYVLEYYQKIDAAFIFVLGIEHEVLHTRSMIEKTILAQILRKPIRSYAISWPNNEDIAYRNLKYFLTKRI